MAVQEIPVSGHLTGTGVQELRNLRLWQKTSTPSSPTEGIFWMNTNTGDKHIYFYDAVLGAEVKVPRLDRAETWTAAPVFNAYFTVPGTTKITNLNCDLIDGYDTSQSTTGSTVAVRNSDGTLNVADGVNPTESVNVRQLDAAIRNRDPKASVRVMTDTALPTNTITGNVITASANGAFPSIDGVTVALNERVGVVYEGGFNTTYDGSTDRRNGIFTLTSAGDASNPWVLTRSTDADSNSEVTSGMVFFVSEGTVNNGTEWSLVTADPITLTTTGSNGTALHFTKTGGKSQYEAGNGIVFSGNKFHAIQSSNYTPGGIVFANSTTTLSMSAALTGILQGNGSSAPDRILPGTTGNATAGTIPKFSSSSPFLTNSLITDNGTTVTVGGAFVVTGASTLATSLTGMLKGASGVVSAVTGTLNKVVKWGTAGTTQSDSIIVDDGTNIGIGMTPVYKLDVNGQGRFAGQYLRQDSTGFSGGYYVNNASGDGYFAISNVADGITTGSVAGDTVLRGSQSLLISIAGALKWSVTTAGILQSNGAQTIQTSTGTLTLATAAGNGNVLVTPHGTGMVGVGTTTPAYKLTVADNIKIFKSGAYSSLRFGDVATAENSGGDFARLEYNALTGSFDMNNPRSFALRFLTDDTHRWSILQTTGYLSANGAQTITNTSGILTLTGTGGVTLSTAANTNIVLAPNGTGNTVPNANLDSDLGTSALRWGAIYSSVGNFSGLVTAAAAGVAVDVVGQTGSASYIRVDQATNNGGKTWRVGHTGSIAGFTSFDIYNQTDNITGLTVAATGAVTLPISLAITTLTAKSILFSGASGVVSQDNANFQYDSGCLSIGIAAVSDRRLYISQSGAKTASTYGEVILNTSTSSTASVDNIGLFVYNSGTWNGASARQIGIWIDTISGGTANWALYNNTAANVYLGTGNTVQLGGSSSGIVSLTTAAAAGTWTLTLPTSGGTADYFLKTNGSGASSWSNSLPATTSVLLSVGAASLAYTDLSGNLTGLGSVRGRLAVGGVANWTALALGTAGQILRSDGTDLAYSTATYPNTAAVSTILYASAANVISALATANSSVLITNSSGVPAWGTNFPTGLTATVGSTTSALAVIKWFNVGDGSSTSITITHNFGTRDVGVQLYENDATDNYKSNPLIATTRPTTNTVVLEFITAPASNRFRAAVFAGI